MEPGHMDQFIHMSDSARQLVRTAIEQLGLSARAYDRILKVSRTIADLAATDLIQDEHVCEAIQYRTLDRKMYNQVQVAA
jgi:magnesium chelatase family protein